MIRILGSLMLLYTCCLKDVTANVPSDIITSLTSSDIASIIALNSNNDGYAFPIGNSLLIASQLLNMEKTVERQASDVEFADDSGDFKGLEYATRTTSPIIHLTYLENEERLLGRTGITAGIGTFGGTPTSSAPEDVSGIAGTCSYKAFSIQTTTGTKGLEIVQFAVYTDSSNITADSIVRESRSAGTVVSTISATGNPKFVVVGTVILAKSSGNPLTQADTQGIVDIVAGRVCEKLETIPTGTCKSGTPVTGPDGQPACSCTNNYFGKTCGILCVNGNIREVPPTDREVCECDFGWGQDGCNDESPVSDFITRTRTTAKTCQSLLTGHAEYVYKNSGSNPIGVDPLLDSIVQDAIIRTRFSTPGNSGRDFRFEELMRDPSYHATMDRTNDLLAAIHVSRSSPITGSITIEHTASYAIQNTVETTAASSGEVGVCSYQYRIVQRFYGGFQQGAAEIFFVSGVQDISTLPTNTSLNKIAFQDGTITDTWTVDGTSMKDIILGFTVIGRYEAGEMSAQELDAVAKCYALEACHSIPIDCGSGQQMDSSSGPICQCTGEVTGIQCQLPLC